MVFTLLRVANPGESSLTVSEYSIQVSPQQSPVAFYAYFGWFRSGAIPTILCFRFWFLCVLAFGMFSYFGTLFPSFFLSTAADPACLFSFQGCRVVVIVPLRVHLCCVFQPAIDDSANSCRQAYRTVVTLLFCLSVFGMCLRSPPTTLQV